MRDRHDDFENKHSSLLEEHGSHKEATAGTLERLAKMVETEAGTREADVYELKQMADGLRVGLSDESTERTNNIRSVWERIQQLESIIEEMGGLSEILKTHSDHHGKHGDRIVEMQEVLESLRSELKQEKDVREADVFELREKIAGEGFAREGHYNSVQELLDAEKIIREASVKDLHNHVQAHHDKLHGAIGSESSAREKKHGSIDGRLAELERELAAHHDKLHGAIGSESSAREKKHGSIEERLAELERELGAQNDKLHGAIGSESSAREEKHGYIDGRLFELEKMLGSLVGKDALSDVQAYLKKLREEMEVKLHQLSMDQGRQDDDTAKLQREIIEESNKREFKCIELEEKIAAHKKLLEVRITDVEELITSESKHMKTRIETNYEELLGEMQTALKHNHEHFTAEIEALWDKCTGQLTHETTLRENAFLQFTDRLGGLEHLLKQYMERPIVDMTAGKLSEEDLLPLQQKLLWLQQSLTADMNKIASAYEAADKEMKFVIDSEQKRREATIVERLEKLNALMDGRMKQEKQERQQSFDSVGRSVDIETQERKKALAKVWAGMDSHTHDLTVSGGEEKSYQREILPMEMAKSDSTASLPANPYFTPFGSIMTSSPVIRTVSPSVATAVKTYSAPPVTAQWLPGVMTAPSATVVHPRPAEMKQMGGSIRATVKSRGLDDSMSMTSSRREPQVITTVTKSAPKVACGKAHYEFTGPG